MDVRVGRTLLKPTTDHEEARMSVRTPRACRKPIPEREWGLEVEEGPIATLRTFMLDFPPSEGGGNGPMSPVGKDLRNQSIHFFSVFFSVKWWNRYFTSR